MTITEIRDRDLLERLLRTDEVWGGYALGDLEEPHFSRTRWRLGEEPNARALVMSYAFGDGLTLMTFGDGGMVATIIREMTFAGECDLHIHRSHLDFVRPLFAGESKPYLRLGVDRAAFSSAAMPADVEIRVLTGDDVPAALELYRHYPRNFFAPERVGEGLYIGARKAGALLAVAGTHVASPAYRAAAIGDIVVDPSDRGRGIGRALTAALCERLFATVDLIVLNVAADNTAARRCYEKLGFARAVLHHEGFGLRRRGDDDDDPTEDR